MAGTRREAAGAPKRAAPSPYTEYERAVAVYTAAGGQEVVQRVVTAMGRVNRRLDVFYRDQLAELGVSHGEWSVLATLAQEGPGGAVTPSRLADVCGVTASTMTHRLDRMVERGLVGRAVDPENRTRMRITLADEGWELFRRAVLEADVVESRIIEPLTVTERRELARLLEKVVAGLRPG